MNMNKLIVTAINGVLMEACLAGIPSQASADETRPNVLMLCIDDMNDWVGFLDGHPQTKTPNMDRLAAKGVNFTNAHCPAPACSPSRNAIMLGSEPYHTGFYPFYRLQEVEPEVLEPYTALPQLLRKNGYITCGASKVFHNPDNFWRKDLNWDDYAMYGDSDINRARCKGFVPTDLTGRKKEKFSVTPGTNPIEDFGGYKTAMHGVRFLEKDHDKPFFLAVGFIRPHLPFRMPEENYDRFAGPIEPPAIKEDDLDDLPPAAKAMVTRNQTDMYNRHNAWENARRGYLASINFTDDNVGRVLKALEKSPYTENTIIILWSDHGFHLNEKESFTKFTLWGESTRTPFIIYDPRGQEGNGKKCDEPVGLINIYQTVCDFTGVTPPEYVDGKSLLPWLKNPSRIKERPAITTWGRGNYSLRTKKWRYIHYFNGDEELYNLQKDPNEWNNLAKDPEYSSLKQEFKEKWIPQNEAPQVTSGRELYNVLDADKPGHLGKGNK